MRSVWRTTPTSHQPTCSTSRVGAGSRGDCRPGFNGGIALVDGMIHHQDIRRPLGKPRHIPADRLRAALEFAQYAPVIRGFWHRRGLRLIATDVDWSAGSGPEVRGPGEAVLLAIAGRDAAVDELAGPGLATLEPRLHKASRR